MHAPTIHPSPITKSFAIFLAFFLSVFVGSAFAEVTIETSISRSRLGVGEDLTLEIIVQNADGPIQPPRIGSIEGFTSYSQGHSQEIQFVNGRMSSKSVFSYVLMSNSVGKKTIGPFEITINGRAYKVAAVEVDVQAASIYGGPPLASSPATAGPVAPPPTRALPRADVSNQDIFVQAWLDKDEVYVNEPAMLTFTLYTRLSATYKGFEKEPVTTGFWVEDFPPEKTIRRTEQILNGARYVVADVRKLALFPQQAGVTEIDPGVLSAVVEVRDPAAFDSFFSSNVFGRRSSFPSYQSQLVEKQIPAARITLTVKALPEAGRPDDFTGAVGDYRFDTSIDKNEVEAGNPVTYRIRLSGRGNIGTLQMPKLPRFPDFRMYDSSTTTNLSKERLVVEGEKISDTVVVPTKPGDYEIPPVSFSYFDPREGRYKTLKGQTPKLSVKPGPDEPAAEPPSGPVTPVQKEEVALTGKDIRYIKTAAGPVAAATPLAARKAFRFGLTALFALWVAGLVFASRRSWAARDAKGERRRRSGAAARRALRKAEALARSGKTDAFYEELSRSVRGYFADRFGASPQSVDAEFALARLPHDAADLRAKTRELFDDLSLARYARADRGEDQMRRATDLARAVIDGYEKQVRPRKVPAMAILLAILVLASSAARAETPSAFAEGNQAYRDGDFKRAASLYEEAVQAHSAAATHYNLGNAYFRLGRRAAALIEYERARRLAPRDADVLWNLQLLKSLLPDRLESSNPSLSERLLSAVERVTADEAVIAFAAAFGAFVLLSLAVALAGRRALWTPAILAALAMVVAGAALLAHANLGRQPLAVLIEREVPVRYGPSPRETAAFTLHEGAEGRVVDRTEDWYYVMLKDGHSGWVPKSACELV